MKQAMVTLGLGLVACAWTGVSEIAFAPAACSPAGTPFTWRVIPNIEASALYPELQRRRLRASEALEIVPR
jgi:hypothetical protein